MVIFIKKPLWNCIYWFFRHKEKKSQWYLRSKTKKKDDETTSISSRGSTNAKTMLERRWSAVSQVASFKRNKKRNSCAANLTHVKSTESLASTEVITSPSVQSPEELTPKKNARKEEDYVRIPKTEYEEIKNRVSAIERRISFELERAEVDPIETVVSINFR